MSETRRLICEYLPPVITELVMDFMGAGCWEETHEYYQNNRGISERLSKRFVAVVQCGEKELARSLSKSEGYTSVAGLKSSDERTRWRTIQYLSCFGYSPDKLISRMLELRMFEQLYAYQEAKYIPMYYLLDGFLDQQRMLNEYMDFLQDVRNKVGTALGFLTEEMAYT